MLPEPLYLTASYEGATIAIAPCFIDKINDFFSWGPNIFPFLHRLLNVGQKLGLFKRQCTIVLFTSLLSH